MSSYYIDSSALISIIFDEPDAKAMKSFVGSTLFTSQITRVEVIRAVYRIAPAREKIARELLETLSMVPLRPAILTQAERLPEKINIRSLDAIHLATANTLDFLRINGLITYDKQMAKGAKELGFEVFTPRAG
jgi:predicted nucleic acid-binding protein